MGLNAQAVSAEDLLKFKFLSDAQLHPEGHSVAFVQTTIEKKQDRYRSRIHMISVDGGRSNPFTTGFHRDWSPRWSLCGDYLAFLSDRGQERDTAGNAAQIFVMPATGGEPQRITDVEGGVLDFQWSPDGRQIAFLARVSRSAAEDGEDEDKDAASLYEKFTADVKHIKRISYRYDGEGYLQEKRTQIFVLSLREALAGGPDDLARPKQLTRGDCDHEEVAWSPDSEHLAVAACRDRDPDMQVFSDVWLFAIAGGTPRKLTASRGPVSSLSWSPDGSTVAYLGHARERGDYSTTRLWIVPADGSRQATCVTDDFDRSFGNRAITDMSIQGAAARPVWSHSGERVYLSASDHGNTHLFSVSINSGEVQQLTEGDAVIHGYSLDRTRSRIAVTLAAPDHPGDVHVASLREKPLRLRRLTRANDALLSSRGVSLPEPYTFTAPDGPPVQGWIIRPTGHEPGGKYPAVLQVHGGPMAMYASSFFFEFQLLAANGIGIIFTNPRGSEGYGQEFCAAIEKEWGIEDYADIMAGVDGALEKFPGIDEERLGVAGGSYGGFMTSWLIGHTDRFRAAVSMRAVNNTYSMHGTSDIGYLDDDTFGGGKPPWDNPEKYLRQSPITYVGNATTPTLIIHSEEDYRCPVEQGEQLFVALKKLGVDTEFIRYPGESHGLSRGGKPWHRVHRLNHILRWFRTHLEPAPR